MTVVMLTVVKVTLVKVTLVIVTVVIMVVVQGSDTSCNPAKSWNGHFPSY